MLFTFSLPTPSHSTETNTIGKEAPHCRRATIYSQPLSIEPDSLLCEASSATFARLLASPDNDQLRLDLANIYKSGFGFLPTSAFYEASFDFVNQIDPMWDLPENTSSPISCDSMILGYNNSLDFLSASHAAYESILAKVNEILDSADSEASALEDLEELMREHGANCAILCEWSASIVEISKQRERVDGPREEAAIAILISMAQNNVFPRDLIGRHAVFFEIARYFRHRNDLISASTAARIALHYANEGDELNRSMKSGIRSEIQKFLEDTEADTGREKKHDQGI
jgi:hypothetical protein